jgi:hypothetical protein
MAETKHWQQLNYGKLVSAPRDAILPGQEHGQKGRSADFPPDLMRDCVPAEIGLGTDDLFPWEQFSWNEQGGFVQQPVLIPAGPYVVSARIRGRPEAGEGQGGRRYTQANYAVLPAGDWNPAQLQPLAAALRAEPLVNGQGDLAPLPVTDADLPLPGDWLERIRLPLQTLMSGVPLSVQDQKQSVEAFLERLGICLAAVPPMLAWRVPCGAGVGVMHGALALAHGQQAMGGLRILGQEARNLAEFDLKYGDFYHGWLADQCGDVTTLRGLVARVAERLPDFADATSAPERPWAELAREISGTLIEEARLARIEHWLLGRDVPRPEAADLLFEYLGERPLSLVLEHRRGRGAELLGAFCGTEWLPHWVVLVRRDAKLRPLAILLGIFPLGPEDDLRGTGAESVPEALRPSADQALAALLATASPRQLAQLVAEVEDSAVLKTWYERQRDALTWRAVTALSDGDEALWQALQRRADAPTGLLPRFAALLRDDCQSLDELRTLLAMHPTGALSLQALLHQRQPGTLARLLVDDILDPRPVGGVVEEVTAMLRNQAADAWSGKSMALRLDAIRTDPARIASLPRTLIVALVHGHALPEHWRQALAAAVGQPYAVLLLAWDAPLKPGPQSQLAQQLCDQQARQAPEMVDHLWRWLLSADSVIAAHRGALDLLGRWLADTLVRLPTERIGIAFVAGMLRDGSAPPPRVLPDEAELALIRAVLSTRPDLNPAELIEQIDTPEQWLSVLALLPPIPAPLLTPEQFVQLQQVRLERPTQWKGYSESFARVGWHQKPVWRLLFDTRQAPKDLETFYLDLLPGAFVLRLRLSGQPVTGGGLHKIDKAILDAQSKALNIDAIYDLMCEAHDAGCGEVVWLLIGHVCSRLSDKQRRALAERAGQLTAPSRVLRKFAPQWGASRPKTWEELAEFGCRLLPSEARDTWCRKFNPKQQDTLD